MSELINFAIVGAGGIAQSYASAFNGHPEARLVAAVDVRLEAASVLVKRFGGRSFDNVNDLLNSDVNIQAAIVCTPPNTHEDIAVQLMRRGIHVLCEKPFALNAPSARRMATQAKNNGVLLTMGSKFRYVEDVTKAKKLIDDGTIGDVVLFENAFTSRVDMTTRWNAMPAISGGGVLIDNGTHSVDIMRYFLGPLAQVHALEGKRIQPIEVEDTVRLFVRSAAGVMGSVDLSWSINKELDWYIVVYGSQGLVQVGWKQSRYKVQGQDWVTLGQGYDKVQAFRSQVNNMVGAIKKREPLRITWEDAIASVEVMESAYVSLRESSWTGVLSSLDLSKTPAPVSMREIFRV